MQTYPIPQMGFEEALVMQFRFVDLVHQHFDGIEVLQAGDYGANPEYRRPRYTAKVEAFLAEFFESEDAILVRGTGTGAIRACLMSILKANDKVLIHYPPVYTTTAITFRAMGIDLVRADLNDLAALRKAITPDLDAVYIQHSRQLLEDHYNLAEVIQIVKAAAADIPMIIDDNYTVMAAPKIGTQLGADLSAFSLFKILGPVGIGCIVGNAKHIHRIREDAYSGGSKVQGPEAMEALRSIVYAPVMLAIEAQVVDEVVTRLNQGEAPGVRRAYISNHQERTVMVELEQPVAQEVIQASIKYGAAPYPVGSASRYEVSAMFYRLSRAMVEADPSMESRFVRINPFRAGADTVVRVLRKSLEDIHLSSK